MSRFKLIIPADLRPRPERFEIEVAGILADFFRADVTFIIRSMSKTADVEIHGIEWEIKSPIGKGRRNIQHQFNRAMKQSNNVVFDARRSKIDIRKIRSELRRQAIMTKGLKRLLLITKQGGVEEIKQVGH